MTDRQARAPMTQEQFLAWIETQPARYEFDGSRPVLKDPAPVTPDVASLGGERDHDQIVANILQALASCPDATSGTAFGSDIGVETRNRAVRYPDVVVTRAPPPDSGRTMPEPVVVFEVSSRTSQRTDYTEKLLEYHAVRAIQRYVVVMQDGIGLNLFRRGAGPHWCADPLIEGDVLALPEIGIEIPISEIYQDVSW